MEDTDEAEESFDAEEFEDTRVELGDELMDREPGEFEFDDDEFYNMPGGKIKNINMPCPIAPDR